MQIKTKEYHYTCGEPSCCDEWGVILYVDGAEIEDRRFATDAYRYVLEELQGHTVDYIDDTATNV